MGVLDIRVLGDPVLRQETKPVAAVTDGLRRLIDDMFATMHAAKAGARAAINLSPEPLSNWAASLSEDALVPVGLYLAIAHPLVFFALLVACIVAAVFLARLLWRGVQRLTRSST